MDTRQSIQDYIYYRNQLDMQKLRSPYFMSPYFNWYNGRLYWYNNMPNSNYFNIQNDYQSLNQNERSPAFIAWYEEQYNSMLNKQSRYGGTGPIREPKMQLFKPLTKVDDVQFNKFTGLNPNELSFKNLVDYKMINPMTRQPYPMFADKIKPLYNGFSFTPTNYTLTPEMKRQITFTMAERNGFKGYNQF
jgi:hypothetical protein